MTSRPPVAPAEDGAKGTSGRPGTSVGEELTHMIKRLFASIGVTLIAVAWLASAVVAGQAQPAAARKPPAAAKTWTPPRGPDGHPDLQGVWSFATLTPLERPSELAEKRVLTDQEAAEFEKQTLQERAATLSTGDREWWDPGTKVMNARRTSLIVDPPDGRLPTLTQGARSKAEAVAEIRRRIPEGPEDRSLSERCRVILRCADGLPS